MRQPKGGLGGLSNRRSYSPKPRKGTKKFLARNIIEDTLQFDYESGKC